MRLYLLVTLVEARIARGKTCDLENGYLNVMEGEKNQFIPTCNSGFTLSESVFKVKCKKGELVPGVVCNSLTTSSPSSTEIGLLSTQSQTTNSLITDQSGCSFENGFLEHINGVKYKPKCQVGYELTTPIIFLKCKKGQMDVTPVCDPIQTATTTSIISTSTTLTDSTTSAQTTRILTTGSTTIETTGTSTTNTPVTLITPYPPPKPTDSSGCTVENGYLSLISGSKYTPICYSGFEMVPNVKTVKCKKGSLSQAINCKRVEISSTSTSTVPITTTFITTTSIRTLSSTIESTETPLTLSTSIAPTTEYTTPVNTSGCTLENGYLIQIDNSNNYQPFCISGFELSDTVDSVKCNKKKKLNIKNLSCVRIVTTPVTSVSTSISSTNTTTSPTSTTVAKTTTPSSTTVSSISTTQSSTVTTMSSTIRATTTSTTSIFVAETTTSVYLVTDQSGCKFNNGYLEHITGTKYKPRCQTGFQMKFAIKNIKCKNGIMNAEPECISIGTTTTSTPSTYTVSTLTTTYTTPTSTTTTSRLTTGTTTSSTVFETTPFRSTTTEFTTTIFETSTELETTQLSTTTYQFTTTRPRTSTSIEFTTTTLTTTGSTTSTELPTSTFMETRTTPPPDHTDPQRDCTNSYVISFEVVDAWDDGFVGLITIPKQALKLDQFGSEYTLIFDMKDENHKIDFETWNVKLYMDYYGTRGWVYHSQPGDEFDENSFAFIVQNIPSGFSRKLLINFAVSQFVKL